MKQLLLFFLSLLTGNSHETAGHNQTGKDIYTFSDFVEIPVPEPRSNVWVALNQSNKEFGVRWENDALRIFEYKYRSESNFKVPDGTLQGTDHGEWGGKLTFIPDNVTQDPILIKNGNVKFIFDYQGKTFFIEGIAHMSISKGSLYRLDRENNKFEYIKLIDFEDAPEAMTIYDGKILIASHKNFYALKGLEKKIVFKETYWTSLYPNSITVKNEENVYIGMRGGITKLNLVSKKMHFYRYTR